VTIYTPLLDSENAADMLGGAAATTEPPNPFLTALLEIDEADFGIPLEGHPEGLTVTIADSDEQEAELRLKERCETSELQVLPPSLNPRPQSCLNTDLDDFQASSSVSLHPQIS
jgi:hypothetical protein